MGQVFRRDIDHLLEDWLNVLIPDEWGKSSDGEQLKLLSDPTFVLIPDEWGKSSDST